MTFADIVSGLKIPSFRSKHSVDNIAWILNCIPLQQEEEQILRHEMATMPNQHKIHQDGEFIIVSQ